MNQKESGTEKNIKIVKWLISLRPAQQVVAMLMIAVLTLFTPLSVIFYKNSKAVDKCNTEKMEIVVGYTKQIQEIKDKQIDQLQRERERSMEIDSALKVTERIIQQKQNELK